MSRALVSTFVLAVLVVIAPAARAVPTVQAAPHRVILAKDAAAIPAIELAPLDRDFLVFQDELSRAKERGRPARVGIVEEVRATPESAGAWTPLADGRMLWRLRVDAPGSQSLGFVFDRYRMPASGTLSIYAADGGRWLKTRRERDNRPDGRLVTAHLASDDAILEVVVAAADRPRLELELTRVQRAYRSIVDGPPDAAAAVEKSGSCNVDVVCPEGDDWQDQIRSVAWYTVEGGSDIFFCTGAMVNNTALNFRNLFLTAFHCFDFDEDGVADPEMADTAIVSWKHQNSTCRTPGSSASGGPGNGPDDDFSQSGATFRAGHEPSDFALLELDDTPASSFDAFWSGWNRSSSAPSSAVTIHHPVGSFPRRNEKRISFEDDPLSVDDSPFDGSPDNHLKVDDWDLGTTEGGSSGAPLFDPSHRIVGQLHGGLALCGNDDADWFGRFFTSWTGGGTTATRLRDWLDPGSTGATTLDGSEPGASSEPAAPSSLDATPLDPDRIQLTWQDNSDNEETFRVEQQVSGSFQEIGFVSANSEAVNIAGLAPAMSYTFRVRARNSAGNSPYSNTATATTPSDAGDCVENASTLCLNNGRFEVQALWTRPVSAGGDSGLGNQVGLTDDTGYFWFFDSTNVEVILKVLNACTPSLGNRYWVFASGLTNVKVDLTVRDTETGAVKVYSNPQGVAFQPIQDTNAFATCP